MEILVGTWESGAWVYDNESINIINDVNGINSWITGGIIDKNDNLWVSTEMMGFTKLKDKIVKNYKAFDGLPSNRIETLDVDNFGNIWGASDKGLLAFRIPRLIYNEQMGFVSNDMHNVKVDNKNTIWVSVKDL